MRKLIKVTKKHIKEGQKKCAYSCPVALASHAIIGDTEIEFLNEETGVWRFTKTPRSVQRFIKRFDNHKKVQPFNFYLNLK